MVEIKKYDFEIMIVEDDEASLFFMNSLLKKQFNTIHIAKNGLEGLQLFEKHRPELIISDVGMPVMDGIQMSREIKNIDPEVKIIFATAFDSKDLLIEAIDIGINNYVSKPIDRKKFDIVLSRVCSVINLERQVKTQNEYIQSLSSGLHHSSSMVLIFNKNFIIEYINPKFEEVTGFNSDEVMGKNLLEIDFYDVFDPTFQDYKKSIIKQKEWKGEFLCNKKNGEKFWILSSLSPIVSAEGSIKKFVQVAEEITTQKEAQVELTKSHNLLELKVQERTAELQSMNNRLTNEIEVKKSYELELIKSKEIAESANKAKSNFLAKVSHELRTPMNGVLGMTNILLDSKIDERQERALKVVKYSADSLLSIINDILDFSKIEAGKLKLNSLDFNIFEILNASLDIIEPIISQKGLSVICNFDSKIPELVIGDNARLQQVFINLLGNAVKFTKAGLIEFSARLLNIVDDVAEIQFSVKDSGIGIPSNFQSELFESFYQVEPTMTRRYGGTGLGLTISKEIVDLMGGKIWFESVENKGSTFYFTAHFPISKNIEAIVAESSLSYLNESFGLNILIVEDSVINQAVLSETLNSFGCSYQIANDGNEGINHSLKEKFDIIFMDLQMPVVDGLTATKAIRTNHSNLNCNTCIIALTAHIGDDHKKECFDFGMNFVLTKPYTKSDIYDMIKNSIQMHREKSNYVPADLKNLVYSVNNNPMVLERIFNHFIKNVDLEIKSIERSLIENKFKELNEKSHKLKSEVGNFGALKAMGIAKNLELFAKNSDNASCIQEFLALKDEIIILKNYIKDLSISELIKKDIWR